jgi:hypothetical protein
MVRTQANCGVARRAVWWVQKRSAGPNHRLSFAAAQALFVLFESASGFALFEAKDLDEIGNSAEKVQESVR